MLYKNCLTVLSDFTLAPADVRVSKGRIMEIVPRGAIHDEREIDLSGRILAPALVDMHIHGCVGRDFSSDEDTADCLAEMSRFLRSQGIAAFAPAAMAMPRAEMMSLMSRYQRASVNPCEGAAPVGIYLEGPFLSPKRCGAQPLESLRLPDFDEFKEYYELSGQNISVVCVAPELDGADEFITKASGICRVSAAHTDADYPTMLRAIDAGVSGATHLYNGMRDISHREPNAAAALLESDVYCELICDGVHVAPEIIRFTFRLKGSDRICLVSDAMSACGLGDGVYRLGSQSVVIKNAQARLSDGTLAGSAATLMDCFHRAVSFGISPLDALKAATINPAAALGVDNRLGSIEVGKLDRLIVFDSDFNFIGNASDFN